MKRQRLWLVLHGCAYLALMTGVVYLLHEADQLQELIRLLCRYLAGG